MAYHFDGESRPPAQHAHTRGSLVPMARAPTGTSDDRLDSPGVNACKFTFQARPGLPLLPPHQVNRRPAARYRRRPSMLHQRRMFSSANSTVS